MKEKKQISTTKYVLLLVLVAVVSIGGTFVVTSEIAKRKKQEEVVYPHEDDLTKVQATYEKIMSKYVGKVNKTKLVDGAIKGMTESLNDPYSDYYSGAEAEELDASISGSFEGIGAVLTLHKEMPTIVEPPIKDSPAEKAKLQVDDAFLKINGKETKGKSLAESVSKVRGKLGTDVTLTIQRGDTIFDVTLKRDKIPVDSVESEMDKEHKNIGVINVTNFTETTVTEFETAIKDLREKGATSFIIDVRGNPGGLLDKVSEMSSMFLKDGETIVKFENKQGNKEQLVAGNDLDHGFKVTEPTVVLVDKNSASASEIFAAALKESANIEVIGTKTFGKGTVQSVEKITEKSELKLTTNKWLTPNGKWIHKKGLQPTIEADFPDYAYLTPIDASVSYQKGSQGPMIKNINGMLSGLGYDTDKKAKEYTDKTVSAVKQVQQGAGLSETGIVDKETAIVMQTQISKKILENDNAYKKAIETLEKVK